MDSIWAVRLVTAVEAVRRKRKAAVRLWLGLGGDEDRAGWGGIVDFEEKVRRKDDMFTSSIELGCFS